MKLQILRKFHGKLDDIGTQIESSSMDIRTLLSKNLGIVQAISSAVREQNEMIKSGFSRQDAGFSRQDANFAHMETMMREFMVCHRRDVEQERLRRESDLETFRRERELSERGRLQLTTQ